MDSAESLIMSMFFDPRRYDLAKVGRYKFNKKLLLKNRISGQILAEDVKSAITGEMQKLPDRADTPVSKMIDIIIGAKPILKMDIIINRLLRLHIVRSIIRIRRIRW